MKGTVKAVPNKKTALGLTLVNGYYTEEDLRQTVSIVGNLSKGEAEQVLKQKDATIMELILCKGLVKSFEAGKEEEFKNRMMKRINCGTTVGRNRIKMKK